MSHIHEKVDFTVTIYVVYNNRVLLRKHDKYPFWLGVGGHIEPEEDPNQAAVRETKEESGLAIKLWSGNQKFKPGGDIHKELIPPVAMNRHNTSEAHEHVDLVYFGCSDSDNVKVELDADSSDDWRWLSKEELSSVELLPDVQFYAELALETLGG